MATATVIADIATTTVIAAPAPAAASSMTTLPSVAATASVAGIGAPAIVAYVFFCSRRLRRRERVRYASVLDQRCDTSRSPRVDFNRRRGWL